MTRYSYAGGAADFVFDVAPSGFLRLRPAALLVWADEAGGVRVTDLQINGVPVTSIPVDDSGQVPAFEGPDDFEGDLWVATAPDKPRIRVASNAGNERADAAADRAEAAAAQAEEAVGLPTVEAILVAQDANPESPVRQAQDTRLLATIGEAAPPKALGPRNLPRIQQGLAPTFQIDSIHPGTGLGEWSHRILSTHGDAWWAFGHDATLRTSADNGSTWFKTYGAPATGDMGRNGMWLTTEAGSLITTWHPYDNTAPTIIRSTDGGYTWTTVVTATTGVDYLGPTAIVQSPTTDKLFLVEYIPTLPAANPTCRMLVSTNDGATWTTWKTLSRAYDTDPEVGVMHFHGIQVDPIDNRVWVCVGDAALSAGLYRLNTAETDWTAIATNRQLDTGADIWGGAVSLMFFPDYIAWGVDQSFTSGLVRMPRSEVGQAVPEVEFVMPLNSTAFYACRTRTDNTEWVLSASQEGGVAAIDNSIHLYRVADDGATCDELSSIPVNSASTFSWAFPLGTPLQARTDRLMWWGTNTFDGVGNGHDLEMTGFQFAGRVGWSHDVIQRPNMGRRFEQPITFSTGRIAGMLPSAIVPFGALTVPKRLRRLYIIDLGGKSFTDGMYNPAIEITNAAGAVINTNVGTPISFSTVSWRAQLQQDTAPYLAVTGLLTAASEIYVRLTSPSDNGTIDASGYAVLAWGY